MAKRSIKKTAKKKTLKKKSAKAQPIRHVFTTEEKRNMAALKRMYEGFGNASMPGEARMKAVLDGQAEDTVFCEHAAKSVIPWGGEHKGKQGWQKFLAAVAERLDHSAYVCQHMQPSGEWVFAWGYFTTKTRDTGKPARCEWQHRLRMRNGKIVECHEFYDSLQAAIDLGWIQPR